MRILLLAILLSGCVSPARREYRDGPMVRAAPTFTTPGYTPAGAGLPEYGAPADAPPLPRSPHARVLPETPDTMREPGLWSGDQPHAGPVLKAGGIVLQAPQEPTDVDYAIMRRCAIALDAMVEELPTIREVYQRLVLGERMCAVARAYQVCAEKDLLDAARGGHTNAALRLKRIQKAAKDMQKWACEQPRDTDAVANVVSLFDRLWGSR